MSKRPPMDDAGDANDEESRTADAGDDTLAKKGPEVTAPAQRNKNSDERLPPKAKTTQPTSLMDTQTRAAAVKNLPPVRKKRRKSRPQDFPIRPLSAYNFFFKQTREQLLISNNEEDKIAARSMAKEIAQRWKALEGTARTRFDELAKEDLKRYRAEVEVYEDVMVERSRQKRNSVEQDEEQGEGNGYALKDDTTSPSVPAMKLQRLLPATASRGTSNTTTSITSNPVTSDMTRTAPPLERGEESKVASVDYRTALDHRQAEQGSSSSPSIYGLQQQAYSLQNQLTRNFDVQDQLHQAQVRNQASSNHSSMASTLPAPQQQQGHETQSNLLETIMASRLLMSNHQRIPSNASLPANSASPTLNENANILAALLQQNTSNPSASTMPPSQLNSGGQMPTSSRTASIQLLEQLQRQQLDNNASRQMQQQEQDMNALRLEQEAASQEALRNRLTQLENLRTMRQLASSTQAGSLAQSHPLSSSTAGVPTNLQQLNEIQALLLDRQRQPQLQHAPSMQDSATVLLLQQQQQLLHSSLILRQPDQQLQQLQQLILRSNANSNQLNPTAGSPMFNLARTLQQQQQQQQQQQHNMFAQHLNPQQQVSEARPLQGVAANMELPAALSSQNLSGIAASSGGAATSMEQAERLMMYRAILARQSGATAQTTTMTRFPNNETSLNDPTAGSVGHDDSDTSDVSR